ncbi:MAG: hypothetical protein AB4426_26865 [Xenococcaceae cyanobacterium]
MRTSLLSPVREEMHHGTPILIRVAVTKHHDEPIKIPSPRGGGDLSLTYWLARSSLGLHLTKEGKDVPRYDPFKYKKVIMTTVNPGKEFTFTMDLRSVFVFPGDEIGKYQVVSGNASLYFEIKRLPKLVSSILVPPGKHSYSRGVEYAVVGSDHDKNTCRLLGRGFNGLFRTIYQLDFVPTNLFGRQLEYAPECTTGCLLVLSSAKSLYVLTPGQAYYGNLRGNRGVIARTAMEGIMSIDAVVVANNWKNKVTDVMIKVSVTELNTKRKQRSVYFRFKEHKMTEISKDVFQVSKKIDEQTQLLNPHSVRQSVVNKWEPYY